MADRPGRADRQLRPTQVTEDLVDVGTPSDEVRVARSEREMERKMGVRRFPVRLQMHAAEGFFFFSDLMLGRADGSVKRNRTSIGPSGRGCASKS